MQLRRKCCGWKALMPKAAAPAAAPPAPEQPARKSKADKLAADTLRTCKALHMAALELQQGRLSGAPADDLAALECYLQQTHAAASAAMHMVAALPQ